MFSLLRRLSLARFALARALKVTSLFNKAPVVRGASTDPFVATRVVARIAHLGGPFEKTFLSRSSQSDACAG
jgi:hypothetical protein